MINREKIEKLLNDENVPDTAILKIKSGMWGTKKWWKEFFSACDKWADYEAEIMLKGKLPNK